MRARLGLCRPGSFRATLTQPAGTRSYRPPLSPFQDLSPGWAHVGARLPGPGRWPPQSPLLLSLSLSPPLGVIADMARSAAPIPPPATAQIAALHQRVRVYSRAGHCSGLLLSS